MPDKKPKSHRKSKKRPSGVIETSRTTKYREIEPRNSASPPILEVSQDAALSQADPSDDAVVALIALSSVVTSHPSQLGVSKLTANSKMSKSKNITVTTKNILTALRASMPVTNTKCTSTSVIRDANHLFDLRWTQSRASSRWRASTSSANKETSKVDTQSISFDARVPVVSHVRRLVLEDLLLLNPSRVDPYILLLETTNPRYSTYRALQDQLPAALPDVHISDKQFVQLALFITRNARRDDFASGLLNSDTFHHLVLGTGNEGITVAFIDGDPASSTEYHFPFNDFIDGTMQLWGRLSYTRDWRTALKGKTNVDSRRVLFSRLCFELHGDVASLMQLCAANTAIAPRSKKVIPMDKSVRLEDGTIHCPQKYVPDHSIICRLLHNPEIFPILSRHKASYLKTGSGRKGDYHPDVFWFRSSERSGCSRVLVEVGTSLSLPDLRRRAYYLCSAASSWVDVAYVVLVKRYETHHMYVEIWKRIASVAGATIPCFLKDQRAPGELGVTETMEFVANAHASARGVHQQDMLLVWQFDLQSTCAIPAGDDLVTGGEAVSFDAQLILNECEYDDPE